MLSQHVHSFWHTKNQGRGFLECRICWLVRKFIFKNIPCAARPRGGVGLCESLNLGHRVVSSCRHQHHAVSWRGSGTGGGGVGPRRVLQPSGRGRGEAELPLGSFGRGKGPVPTLGQEPRWRQEHMLTVFRAPAWGCLTEAPGGKGWKQGPRPNWHRATHIPAKPAAFIFSSLS